MIMKKLRRTVPLLISAVLCLSTTGCSLDGAFAIFGEKTKEEGEQLLPDYSRPSSTEEGNTGVEDVVVIEEEQDPGEGTAEAGAEGLSGFDYDQLSAGQKSAYEQLYTGVSGRKSEFYINAESAEDVGPALRALLGDHPEFFWITGSASIYGFPGPGIKRITLEFNIDPAEIDSQQAMIEAEAAGYLEQIYDGMSEYEKVRLAYEYVIRNTDYVMGAPQSQNIQSSMIYHQSVCAGYAREFKYLLDRAGVFCAYVEGDITDSTDGSSEAHAWNLVMIDGEYYYLDATEGDPYFVQAEEQAGMAREADYSYMCLTSEDLMRMGYVPSERYAVPETYARTWDYYVVNGYYHDHFDYDEIRSTLMSAAETGENSVYMKFSDFESYAAAVDAVMNGGILEEAVQYKMSLTGMENAEYLPIISDALLTINIFW